MKKITVGTLNPAKVEQIRGALSPLKNLVVLGIKNKSNLPDIKEDGKTAQENARKKAIAYAEALGCPVLSMDIALYFDDLEGDERQPGIKVRMFAEGGVRPTDQEALDYYSDLIESLGGETRGRWEFAVCVATPEGDVKETIIISPRVFTSEPGEKVVAGYPLESLQKDPKTGKYISDMTSKETSDFWNNKIGKPLQEFISSIDF